MSNRLHMRFGMTWRIALVAVVMVLASYPVLAHAFGERYELPVPLWMFAGGGGAAVALSFVVMVFVMRHPGAAVRPGGLNLGDRPPFTWLFGNVTRAIVEAISIACFAVVLYACFFGDTDPFDNIAPTFVWVIWWVGMAFASALIGNVWDLVNPWRILFDRLIGSDHPAIMTPPRWLGYLPSIVLFLGFAWLELISGLAEKPRVLGSLIIGYSIITWTGMSVFGRRHWLDHGEAFSVVFRLLARFAPLRGDGGRLTVRWPATGLIETRAMTVSYVYLVLLVLTTVSFDGLLETPLWQGILHWIAEEPTIRGTLVSLQRAGVDLIILIETVGLIVAYGLFVAAFHLTCAVMALAGGRRYGRDLVGWFVLSLVPIAIAYHLAHYASYLMLAGQNIVPLLSDPFGYGWNMFKTATYQANPVIVTARTIWYLSLFAVVAGHIAAVYVAHVMAIRVFADRRAAVRSQWPMMVLMVVYTSVGLWLLAQPLTEVAQ